MNINCRVQIIEQDMKCLILQMIVPVNINGETTTETFFVSPEQTSVSTTRKPGSIRRISVKNKNIELNSGEAVHLLCN